MARFPQLPDLHKARLRIVCGVGARVAIILFVLLALVLGFAAWQVAGSGISLAFLKETVRSRVATALGPAAVVDLDGLDLTWRSDTGLSLTARDLSVESADTGLRIVVPEIDAALSPLALATGKVAPRSVRIVGPAVRVPIVAAEAETEIGASSTAIISRALRAARDLADDRGLRRIAVEGGKVDVTFGPGSRDLAFWHDLAMTIDVRPDARGMALDLTARGQGGPGRITADYGPDEEGFDRLTVKGSDFSLIDMVPAPEILADVVAARIPLYPDFTIAFDKDDSIHSARMEVVVGAGKVDVGEGDIALLDEARFIVTWDRDAKAFKLRPSIAEFGETKFHFSGYLRPTTSDTLDRWRYGFDITDAVIKPRDDPGPAVHLDHVHTEGRISASSKFVGIESLEVDAGGRRIVNGAGSLGIGPSGPSLALALDFAPVSGLMVKRLWPNAVAAPARRWVLENLVHADQMQGSAVFALGPENLDGDPETYGWGDDAMDINFQVMNATVRTFGNLPNVTIPAATGSVKGGLFVLTADTASAVTPAGRKVDIRNVRFSIDDVRPPDKDAEVAFNMAGETAGVAEIANAEPLRALRVVGVKPGDLSGRATADVEARFPLIKDLKIDDASWHVAAKLDDFASARPINGQKITKGSLLLEVDPKRAQISGRAQFDGLAVDVDLVEPLDGSDANARRDMTLVLTDAERSKRGIALDPLVKGPIGVAIDGTGDEKKRKLTVDLTSARLELPGLGVVKKAGQRGSAELVLVETGGGTEVRDLTVRASGLDIAGSARIDKAGKVVSVNLQRFTVGDTKGARLTVARQNDGTLAVTLKADQFDGRAALKSLMDKDDSNDGASEPLHIEATIGRLIGLNGQSLSGVTLDLATAGGQTRRLDMSGILGGSDRLSARIRADGGKRYLSVETTDMGSALRMLDLYGRMRGGRGVLQATLVGEGRAAGSLKLRNFAIADDPGLREIIRRTQSGTASANNRPIAVQPQPQAVSGNAAFERLDVTFSMNDDRIKVGEAVLRGTVIGGTMRGAIDLKTRRIDMVGTMVPAYGINNLFGRIPLVGEIVGGGSDGGLIGITFKMDGPIDNARLTFNPVSAVAPGIFRKIFEYR